MSVLISENEEELIKNLGRIIQRIANSSIRERDIFKIGVSGGSLVKLLVAVFVNIVSDFSKWKIFFCDERLVTQDNSESTYGTYKEQFAAKYKLTEEQFIRINENLLANVADDAKEVALDYERQILVYFPPSTKATAEAARHFPRFDLLLLGMGPDGHTCSLFPGHPLLEENDRWIAEIIDSPKPPPERITMTLPVLNNAENVVFPIAGEGKATMLRKILINKEPYPAGMVKPKSGNLYWLLDKAAAKLIE